MTIRELQHLAEALAHEVRNPLNSMAIHVETENGTVMLSGFVDSKADADKAVSLARSVEGVTNVKSALKVK